MSCTRDLVIAAEQVESLYEDIECKQFSCVLLDASRNGYVHHDAARRTRIRLKRGCDSSPVCTGWGIGTSCFEHVAASFVGREGVRCIRD
ncbi:hypothetical protein TNCV_1245671 [Trichonephila clavipes]|uniref:Uncharacterized protein n=1 Tax=Trichonephila clavipes TaxID=2585209 RepID=A0A8X6RKV3_TRICX|nr:hypothetical protein TNCV_1245671 [Trichonephila clavipes]